jgi:anti-anti-sigma factor
MAPISVTIEQEHPPVGTVTLVGEHDAYSAERIANEIEVILDAGMPVVIDLTDATFVDSQTLSVLLSGRHRAHSARLGFTLVLPDTTFTQVHRILQMTGLGSWFATHPSLPEAVAGARAGHSSGDRLKVA